VVVANAVGSAISQPAILTVLVPAFVITPPQALTVTNGDTATFSVLAGGTDPLAYQWTHASTNLDGQTASILTLNNVQSTDAGDYAVVVSNVAGTATSSPARLTVATSSHPNVTLTSVTLSGGQPEFTITGPPNSTYVVWKSENLPAWVPVSTNASADGTLHYVDSGTNGLQGYYRVSLTP